MTIQDPKYLLVELNPSSDATDLQHWIMQELQEFDVLTITFADEDGLTGGIVRYPTTTVERSPYGFIRRRQ